MIFLLTGPTKNQVLLDRVMLIVQRCLYRKTYHIPFVFLCVGQHPLDWWYFTSLQRRIRFFSDKFLNLSHYLVSIWLAYPKLPFSQPDKKVACDLITKPPYPLAKQELLFSPVLFFLHFPVIFQLPRLTVMIPSAIMKPSQEGGDIDQSGNPIPPLNSTFLLLPFVILQLLNECFSVSLIPLKIVTLFSPLDYQEISSSAAW